MYARELMLWLHERLEQRDSFEQTQKRFERLRGYGLIPRGRENAGARLSDEQIASAVLGFSHPLPGFAGHASLILGSLCPVGGPKETLWNKTSLQGVIAALIGTGDKNSGLRRMTLSVEQDFKGDEYAAVLYLRGDNQARAVSFVSKHAYSLLNPGAEEDYDHEHLDKPTAAQRSFGSRFFRDLSRAVSISRYQDRPLQTDWREYETEEEKAELHRRLGAQQSSHFLNLRVEPGNMAKSTHENGIWRTPSSSIPEDERSFAFHKHRSHSRTHLSEGCAFTDKSDVERHELV